MHLEFSERLLEGLRSEARCHFWLKKFVDGKHMEVTLKDPVWKSFSQLAGNYEDNSLVKDNNMAGANKCYQFLSAKHFVRFIWSRLDDFSVEV